jgi:F0F1-type ATP synthase beta subunit
MGAVEVRQSPEHLGRVTAVRGAVVEVDFPAGLPAIYEALTVAVDDREIVLEVVLHLDLHTVRALAMDSVAGLARGTEVHRTEAPISVPVGPQTLGRLFNVLGEPLDGLAPLTGVERWPIHRPAPSSSNSRARRSWKPGSRSSTCWRPWRAAARPGWWVARAWVRPSCWKSSSAPR